MLRLTICVNQAKTLLRQEHYEQALERLRQAERLQVSAHERFPGHVDFQVELSDIHTARGFCLMQMKNKAEAGQSYRAALAVIRPIAEAASASQYQRHQLGIALINFGAQLEAPQKSRDAYQEARDIFQRLAVESPDVPAYRQWLSGACHNLASTHDALGDPAKATALRRESLQLFEKQAAEFPKISGFTATLGMSYCNLGAAELKYRKVETALEWFTKALAILEPLHRHDLSEAGIKQQLADAHGGIGSCLGQMGRYAEALAAIDRAVALENGKRGLALYFARQGALFQLRQESLPALKLARKGEDVKAVAAIEALIHGRDAHPEMDYNAAGVYAICADKVMARNSLLAQTYAERAVALLVKAQAAGLFKDAGMLKQFWTDKDFEPLRRRQDFKRLEAGLTSSGR